ncbi:MAG: LTA synthase family protein [Bacillota bacterium]|nr:MAG: LTA synthase family protein [Bacillota bacterium]
MKKFFRNLKQTFHNGFQKFKKNPKLFLINILVRIREYVKSNVLFFLLILTSVFNALLLRYFTIHTLDNFLNIAPVLADAAIVTLFASFCYLMKPKKRFPYLFILSIIFTAICMINSIYYSYYNSFSSISLLSTSRFVSDVGDAVVDNVLEVKDFVYLFEPVVMLIVYYVLKRNGINQFQEEKKDDKTRIRFKKSIGLAIGLAVVFCFSLTPVKIGRFANMWNREYIVMHFGIYTYHLNDFVKSLEPKLSTIFGYDQAVKTFHDHYDEVSDTQDYTNDYTGIFQGKNVIVIHAESIQQFVIGMSFNGEELTPNLNKLASESIYFDNFYSQVSVGTSSDAEFTSLTSLMPTNTGTAFVSYFDRTYVSMPSLLSDKGYYTFVMHANKANFWNRDLMYASLGYQRFYSKDDYDIDEVVGLGLSDTSFFRQSVEKLKEINEMGKLYYGTLIMLSNHTPFIDSAAMTDYEVDMKEEVTLEDGTVTTVSHPYMEGTKLGQYLKSVHYADQALGEFIDLLESEGLLENTVLVLYGDHDARLDINDYVRLYNYDPETNSILSPDDPDYINFDEYQYELNRKVPFMIWSSETKEKLHKTVSDVMGMYDVMPTLGNMLGVYNKYALGHDIFQIGSNNIVVFPNGNWVTNSIYYNAQKGEYLSLAEAAISADYIEKNNEYADEILNTSNSLITFDLIQKTQEGLSSEVEYVEERKN